MNALDWALFRKGWTSCTKARAALGDTPIRNELDARREGFDADAACALLKSARRIRVARGKTVVDFDPRRDDRDTILAAAIGPSGRLRAPALRRGRDWLVGFHEEALEELLG